jgi:hypothetical protein
MEASMLMKMHLVVRKWVSVRHSSILHYLLPLLLFAHVSSTQRSPEPDSCPGKLPSPRIIIGVMEK